MSETPKTRVLEAVVIAALSAAATGLINWDIEVAKKRKKKKNDADTPPEAAK